MSLKLRMTKTISSMHVFYKLAGGCKTTATLFLEVISSFSNVM